MKVRLSIFLILTFTFALLLVTFLDISPSSATFRGNQAAGSGYNKKSRKAANSNAEASLASKDSNLESNVLGRNLQDTASSSVSETTGATSGITWEVKDWPTQTATIVNPLVQLNQTQITESQEATGALNHGINLVIEIGILQKNVPSLPNDYAMSELLSASYRKYKSGSLYFFKIKMASSTYKCVDANFTVYYNGSTQAYTLKVYSYHSYNYTKDDIQFGSSANPISNKSFYDINGTLISNEKTPLTWNQIDGSDMIFNGLFFGVRNAIKTGINQNQLCGIVHDYTLHEFVKGSYRPETSGVRYWFRTTVGQVGTDFGIEANFTVFWNNNTNAYKLTEYSYLPITINITVSGEGLNDTNSTDSSDETEITVIESSDMLENSDETTDETSGTDNLDPNNSTQSTNTTTDTNIDSPTNSTDNTDTTESDGASDNNDDQNLNVTNPDNSNDNNNNTTVGGNNGNTSSPDNSGNNQNGSIPSSPSGNNNTTSSNSTTIPPNDTSTNTTKTTPSGQPILSVNNGKKHSSKGGWKLW